MKTAGLLERLLCFAKGVMQCNQSSLLWVSSIGAFRDLPIATSAGRGNQLKCGVSKSLEGVLCEGRQIVILTWGFVPISDTITEIEPPTLGI